MNPSRSDIGGLVLAAPAKLHPDGRPMPVSPRRLDEHAAHVAVAGIGDRAVQAAGRLGVSRRVPVDLQVTSS
jgi:hypothetical protein